MNNKAAIQSSGYEPTTAIATTKSKGKERGTEREDEVPV